MQFLLAAAFSAALLATAAPAVAQSNSGSVSSQVQRSQTRQVEEAIQRTQDQRRIERERRRAEAARQQTGQVPGRETVIERVIIIDREPGAPAPVR